MAQFEPGKSGNPKGKPKGAQRRFTKMREELKSALPALLESTKKAALSGDMTAMRLLLERTRSGEGGHTHRQSGAHLDGDCSGRHAPGRRRLPCGCPGSARQAEGT